MVKRTAVRPIIHSTCQVGSLYDALRLFSTRQMSLELMYREMLQLCIDRKARKQGCEVHGQLISGGFASDLTLNGKLIVFYGQMGDMVNARQVFDMMPERNIVSWTALLSGFSSNGFFEDALAVFSEMHHSGVKANQFAYGSALKACTRLVCLGNGKQIQGCIQKSRFIGNLFVQSALVDLHSRCGDLDDARYIFETMSKRDLVCWNCMIGGYAVQGFTHDSFQMFQSMLREGLSPDCFTLGSLLGACKQGGNVVKVCKLHAFMLKLGFQSHDLLSGLLVDAYAKCGSIKGADRVFNSMQHKDVLSCTAMICGYAREANFSIDTLDLFSRMYQSGMAMDAVLLCSMLSVCANIVSLSLGRQIHTVVLKRQPGYDVALGNALIDMYAKCGELGDANRAFDEVEGKNVVSWSSLIGGYAKHGYGHEAITMYKLMEHEGVRPNGITFLSLLFACSHGGLINDGLDCFTSMISKYEIAPREKHYSCMIDLFARGGWLEEALHLIHKMNINPNASLWGAILGACSIHGNISLGEVAAQHLFHLDPESSSYYAVLASLYAKVGLWGKAWITHRQLEKQNLKKNPGCSYFPIKSIP
ncbi:hypothetical protein Ancab_004883 [Ancistrocladus abbreviatus]